MNKIATKAIVEVCRMREREGDCVVTTQPHSSILESVILELAAQLDVAVEQACAVNAGAEQDDRKTVAPWRKLVKELFLAEEAGDVKFRDCQWASEWSREALCLCGGRPDSVPLAPGVKDAPLHGALAYLTAEVAQYQNPERAPSRIKRAKELLEGLAAEAGKAQAEQAVMKKTIQKRTTSALLWHIGYENDPPIMHSVIATALDMLDDEAKADVIQYLTKADQPAATETAPSNPSSPASPNRGSHD